MSAAGPLPELGDLGEPLHGEPLRGFRLGPSRGLPPLKFPVGRTARRRVRSPVGRTARRRVRPPLGERPHVRPESTPQPAPTVVVQAAPRPQPVPQPTPAPAPRRRESPAPQRHAAMHEVLGQRVGEWEAHLPDPTRRLVRSSVRQHVRGLQRAHDAAGHERVRELLREARAQDRAARQGMTPAQREHVRGQAQASRDILDSMQPPPGGSPPDDNS